MPQGPRWLSAGLVKIQVGGSLGSNNGFSEKPMCDFQRAHKRVVNVYITFTIAFRIGPECPFIKRLVLVKT